MNLSMTKFRPLKVMNTQDLENKAMIRIIKGQIMILITVDLDGDIIKGLILIDV